ncbi:MAG: arginase [Pseudomonadota bacterium]
MAEIALLGVPMEDGAGRRGCAMGPAAYRTAGIVEELAALGHDVTDLGDLAPANIAPVTGLPEHVKRPTEVAAWTRALAVRAKELAGGRAVPVYMGGDHVLALGSVAGHAAAAGDRPLFVLWLDAHSDFNTYASSPSGNLHGMPLAFACGVEGGAALLGDVGLTPVAAENVCLLGVRSVDGEEKRLLGDAGALAYDMGQIDEHGISRLLRPFLERVADANGLLHVSLDVDFLDPEIAPAVGTTVPGGATFREAHLVMELLGDSGLVTSLDLVELNPFLDERGKTARLMVDLAASLFGRRVLDRPTHAF